MDRHDTTHRLHLDQALCGEESPALSPYDAGVTCPACLALIDLAERRRRSLVCRSLVLIGKLASA
jgi:hypothetical protein